LFSRIIILTPKFSGKDGISTVSRSVMAAFSEGGMQRRAMECWSLLESSGSIDQDTGSAIYWRNARGRKWRLAYWGLRPGTRDHRETLVLAMHLHLAPVALPLIARGAKLAVFLHGIEAWKRLAGLRKLAVSRAWQVIGNSNYTIRRFQSVNPECARSSIGVCHLGISRRAAEPAEPAFGAAPLGPFALVVGRMAAEERYKGHDLLIDMWPRMVSEFPAASLVIAGEGDDRERLEAKAARLGLGEKIKFLGKVSDEVLAALYRDCAFFVMPSSDEGFGLVFLEAMRSGKACIGASGAASEVISDGVTGMIVKPTESEEVFNAVLRLFREPELRKQMGRAGAARFVSHFTDDHFRKRLCSSLALESHVEDLSIMSSAAYYL
jgi:phosphatidylinositol alpha-1,6-mannosyltransferase